MQIGAPSRTDIERYKNFLDEVSAESERINARTEIRLESTKRVEAPQTS